MKKGILYSDYKMKHPIKISSVEQLEKRINHLIDRINELTIALNAHLEWHKKQEYSINFTKESDFKFEPKQECKVCQRCLGVDGCMCALEPEELKKKYPLPTNTKEELRRKLKKIIENDYVLRCWDEDAKKDLIKKILALLVL